MRSLLLRRWRGRGQRRRVRREFDPLWYATNYGIPERLAWGHFVREGASLGNSPNGWFMPEEYLAFHRDVAQQSVDPFFHYILFGKEEGRALAPQRDQPLSEVLEGSAMPAVVEKVVAQPSSQAPQPKSTSNALNRVRRAFDADYYVRRYGHEGGVTLDSYLALPEYWGRCPNIWFDGSKYLDLYPDVKAAEINPLLHYFMAGVSEGRMAHNETRAAYSRALAKTNVIDTIDLWHKPAVPTCTDPEWVARDLSSRLQDRGRILISLGNDDYSAVTGGIQLVISEERRQCSENGWLHWYLYPTIPSPLMLSRGVELNSIIDGEPGPTFSSRDLANILRSSQGAIEASLARVHGLLGWDLDLVVDQIKDLENVEFHVHDMASVCPNYTLTINDEMPCGAPDVESGACEICSYGPARRKLHPSVIRLLSVLDPVVVLPSVAAQVQWEESMGKGSVHLIRPHGQVRWTGVRTTSADKPRLAYLGMPSSRKGFDTFLRLADWNLSSNQYDLYWLGSDQFELPGVTRVGVNQVGHYGGQMTQVVCELGIHGALVCPIGFETYSFVAHEALAGGASLLTHRQTGNVASLAAESGRGIIAEDPRSLLRLLRSPRVAHQLHRDGITQPIGIFEFASLVPGLEGLAR